ncbi:hypothetical protein LR48_Vigan08g107000 [Vigna angularis]|uniref:Uncharacterized protein n=2 Tax=Phaseolus angularis TaxID=3914 RepID=A0A0L9V5I9_PHAAN|nr:hypothetical protein LR48_Vigan08g107000 [Vigna angularis]BAT90150.1 hypothetical protein VIGAN_06133600 [Vigna angularis var. angularis]
MRWIPLLPLTLKRLVSSLPSPCRIHYQFLPHNPFVFSLKGVFVMAGFEQQVKDRAKELKVLLKKGVKIVGDSCKKGWNKVKHIKR